MFHQNYNDVITFRQVDEFILFIFIYFFFNVDNYRTNTVYNKK